MGFRHIYFEKTNGENGFPLSRFGCENAQKVRSFHESFPEYAPTPLRSLRCLAKELGLGGIYVKDESFRFGLNAFKILGGSYAIGRVLGDRLGILPEELTLARLTDKEAKNALGELCFVTATDGNHGRGVAWTAARLGQKSVVYMPAGSAAERLANIRALGAEASITPYNYDDSVRLARAHAEKYGWVLVQDTAWDGYEQIPCLIMEGYTTMALEALEQLHGVKPTHIFLQAGVGSMAAAVAAFFTSVYGADKPIITVVEPNAADCFYKTAAADDGKLHCVTGSLNTMMAGLACGEPSPIAWDILRSCAAHFVSMPDYAAAEGMRLLASPMGSDAGIVSGESGASAFGLVAELMRDPALAALRKSIGMDENSRVLCFSTEGDTDRENYRRIVRNGQCTKA